MTEPARFPSMRLQISYIGGMLAGALCWLMMVPVHAQDRDALRSGASSDTTQSTGTVFTAPSRVDTLNVVGGGPFLVRPFMEAGSERIRVNGSHVGNDAYLLDARKGLITLRDIAPDSSIMLVVAYRYVPLTLEPEYRLWPEQEVDVASAESGENVRTGRPVQPGALATRGRITRGIMTGNNRNARIESGLQLEVEGEVAPGVMLEAELTDEDTPLVPEGVTRQFDQFDRIRIGLESRYGRVDLGDFDAVLENTRYGVLRRKLQGASISTASLSTGSSLVSSLQVSAGAAISRGQFHSVNLEILEGVQGPYRLTGSSGERFILVLPGTERVYLDGVLLERGVQEDYVMDYALGELTFTARHVMGRDKRVRVDYEYTTNRYTRTMSFSEARLGLGGTSSTPWATLTLGGIREADGEAFVDESGLSSADSALVASSVEGTVEVDGAVSVSYDPEALYTQYVTETTPSGERIYTELRRQPASGETVYRVPFSFVGNGQGDYIRIPSQSGGIAYEWVGDGNGAYEAKRTLPVPSRKMLGEVRLRIHGLPGIKIESGISASSLDRNRLSASNASVLNGSIRDLLLETDPLGIGRGWVLSASGRTHVRTTHFETFERVRSVEFSRDWGLPFLIDAPFTSLIPGADERLQEASLRLSRSDSSFLSLSQGRLSLGDDVDATKQHLEAGMPVLQRMRLGLSFERTDAEGVGEEAFLSQRRFAKARLASISITDRWQPWLEVLSDQWSHSGSNRYLIQSGNSQVNRIPFRSAEIGVRRSWQTHVATVSGSLREEEDVVIGGSSVLAGSTIQVGQANWEWRPSPRVRTSSTVGWRRSQPGSPSGAEGVDAKTSSALLVGLNGQVRSASVGTVRWEYQVRSEQSAAMQEVFIRTGPERGHFVWQDINADGLIQLDEFFPETTPGEGEYARTLFPSDSLESVTTAEARLAYAWLPTASAASWRKVAINATIDLRESTRTADRKDVYLLRPSALRQAGQTLNGRIRMFSRIGLFPLKRVRDLDLSLLRTVSLSELASGAESTDQTRLSLEGREEVRDNLDLTLESAWATESSDSEQFSTRAFDIKRWEIRPGSIYRFSDWRVQSAFMLSHGKEDRTGARVRTWRVPVNLYWSKNQMRWRTGAEWSESSIEGGAPLGLQLFELTEGRGAGTSWMWHVHLDVQLTEIVSATLRYDGRQPTGLPVIHTGRFQLSARF